MKFQAFREFRPGNPQQPPSKNFALVFQYLVNDLAAFLKDWATGFLHLNFDDNFDSYRVDVEIPAGEEIPVLHKLGVTPDYYLILNGNEYSPFIVNGDEEWSKDFIYLKNVSTTVASSSGTAIATIMIFKSNIERPISNRT